MVSIKSTFSRFKRNAKNKAQNGAQKFKENFSEAKSKPKLKRKSLLLSFITVLGLFGVTLFASALAAFAEELTKPITVDLPYHPRRPTISPVITSQRIINGLAGAAVTISIGFNY